MARAKIQLKDMLTAATGVVLLVRLTVLEPRDLGKQAAEAGGDIAGPGAALTLVLAAVMVALVGAWLVQGAIRGRLQLRGKGWVLLLLVLSGWTALSAAFAPNRFAALLHGADWIAVYLLAAMLVQILDTPQRVRLFLAVMLAAGALIGLKCIYQVHVETPETIRYFEEHREEFIKARRWEPDGEMIRNFEARLRGGDATGYVSLGNVAASMICLFGLTTLGVVMSNRRPWGLTAAGAGVLVILAWALILTLSRGGLIACGVGLAGLALLILAGKWLRRYNRQAALVVVVVILLAAAGTIGWGLRTGGLPGLSLTYRWVYWQGAAGMVADHPLLGVGPGNFGGFYPAYKPLWAPEEVRSAHNVFVDTAAQMGVPGVILLIAVLGWGFVWIARRGDMNPHRAEQSRRLNGPVLLWIGIGFFLCRGMASGTLGLWFEGGKYPLAFYATVVWLILPTGIILLAMTLFDALLFRGDRWLLAGLGCGLAAFLLHAQVDMGLFNPAGGTLFWTALSTGIAYRLNQHAITPREWRLSGISRGLIGGAAILAPIVFFGLWVVPVLRSESLARSGRFLAAANANPIDAGAWLAAADDLLGRRGDPDEAVRCTRRAIHANPRSHGSYEKLAQILELAGGRNPERLDEAESALRQAIRLYPGHPQSYAYLGRIHRLKGRPARARQWYRKARCLDEAIRRGRRAHGAGDGGKLSPRWQKEVESFLNFFP